MVTTIETPIKNNKLGTVNKEIVSGNLIICARYGSATVEITSANTIEKNTINAVSPIICHSN
ncbi:hypothetical protein D3C85_1557370 [compost metagenome]